MSLENVMGTKTSIYQAITSQMEIEVYRGVRKEKVRV